MVPVARQSNLTGRGVMTAMHSSTDPNEVIWDRNSQYDGPGTVDPPKPGSGLQERIKDALEHGTDSYRDIDNGFGGGAGHDGNGSPQIRDWTDPNFKVKKDGPDYSAMVDHIGGGKKRSNKPKNYYEAPLASKYGFNKATAYQEALANTAYRREMADMRKAGLNPSVIYGDHNTSGAGSSIYPRENSSGGSGGSGYSRRSGGGRRSGNYLFSGGAYYGIMAAAALIATAATKNVGAGMAAAGITGTALKALNGFFGK